MGYRDELEKNGFIILRKVFTKNKIRDCREEIINYVKTRKTIKNSKGITIVDFVKDDYFKETRKLKNKPKIVEVLEDIFQGTNYRFCSHNDIGVNRVQGWHKDKLNGEVSKYETVDIWSSYQGEKHEIVKVLIYLEDHSKNNDGLILVPESHLKRDINTYGAISLHPKIGDVVIFDQRITHRGMERQVPYYRILVSFGFGKNNIFTDNFEKGTIARQNKRNNIDNTPPSLTI